MTVFLDCSVVAIFCRKEMIVGHAITELGSLILIGLMGESQSDGGQLVLLSHYEQGV